MRLLSQAFIKAGDSMLRHRGPVVAHRRYEIRLATHVASYGFHRAVAFMLIAAVWGPVVI